MTGNIDMPQNLVSIVVCAFNNWPDLDVAVCSALQQSHRQIEVIVVDNSSTDATAGELQAKFGGRIRHIRQPNKDCAGAYNTGFAAASGEFIQFMDGDDVLAPNKVAKQLEIFRSDPQLDIVYGDIRNFERGGGTPMWADVETRPEPDMLEALLLPGKYGAGINALGALFHRRAVEKTGPWDEDLYCEDTEYWLRAAWRGCRFGHCPSSPMGFKRIRPGQKTADLAAMDLGLEAVLEKALAYIVREPYRRLIAQKLAQHRFYSAVSGSTPGTVRSLRKLTLARNTSAQTVSVSAYAFGLASILVPGGRIVVRSPWLRPLRRNLAWLASYNISR